jgi:hypothetical protein
MHSANSTRWCPLTPRPSTKAKAPKYPAVVIQNGNWSRTAPEIVIFDDDFVAENVCSGIEVGATHRQTSTN